MEDIRISGAQTIYSQERAEAFCFEYATSTDGLRAICNREGMPSIRTVMYWLRQRPDFAMQYRDAQMIKASLMVEDIMDTVKGGENDDLIKVNRDKIRMQAVQWVASKYYPKFFGDKMQIETTKREQKTLTEEQYQDLRNAMLQKCKQINREHTEDAEYEEEKNNY